MSKAGYSHALGHAQEVAERLEREVARFADRAVIAGSIRRKRPMVGDIDLVIQPTRGDSSALARHVRSKWGEVIRGGPKYIRVIHGSGIAVCVNMVTPPAHWGVLLAARTGPAALWIKAKEAIKAQGYTQEFGEIRKGGRLIPCPDEETFFALAGLPYLSPDERDLYMEGLDPNGSDGTEAEARRAI